MVVVPARNEEANLWATLEALRMAEYPWIRVIVVDDRSTDGTGAIAREFAEAWPERFSAIRIEELPEGWLGKTFAMQVAYQEAQDADYVLFTDADIVMSPSLLWRALAYAEHEEADHLVVMPTPLIRTWGEGVMLGFFQVMATWAIRPWKIADPKAKRDVAGVGAFNLVRKVAFDELGGWEPQRMVVLEDITLGRRMKSAGMRQRVAFAPGLVLVHWAAGMGGLVKVMTKNLFSGVNFRPVLLLGGVVWLVVFCLGPIAGLLWRWTLIPSAFAVMSIASSYKVMGEVSEIGPQYGWGFPLGVLAMMWAMLRSMGVVLWQRGVVWRGTYYGLRELRRHNSPFKWEREAARRRLDASRVGGGWLRRVVDGWRKK
jgi:glycosyltransferase involved in cell wall biosynthesis